MKAFSRRIQAPRTAVKGVMPKLQPKTFGQTRVPVKGFQPMKKGPATKIPGIGIKRVGLANKAKKRYA